MARKQVLTGSGNAQSQIFIEEGGGAFAGLPISDGGVLVGSAMILNFAGTEFGVAVDGVDPTQINITLTSSGILGFTQAARPAPGANAETPAAPRVIYNITALQLQISNGTDWRDAEGNLVP